MLGGQRQLGGHLAQHLDDHQPAQVRLEVAEEAADIAPGGGQPGGGVERGASVAVRDGIDGGEQQVGVGGAEHGEHVVEPDLRARVGDQLLERAERVAEGAGRGAGDQRGRLVGDRDVLARPRPPV